MKSSWQRCFPAVSLLLFSTLLGIVCAAAGAENPAGESAAAQSRKKATPAKGRLPAYYRAVVTDKQRQKIYAIQSEYDAEIHRLKKQLKTLTEERDTRISAVLNAQQRAEVVRLREAAKAKRRKAKEPASTAGDVSGGSPRAAGRTRRSPADDPQIR